VSACLGPALLPIHLQKYVCGNMTLELRTCVNNYPTRCNNIQFICVCKLLYMFRVVSLPIIRSSFHCIYSIWHYWDRYCYLLWTWLDGNCSQQLAVTVSIMPDTVDTVIWAADDGWRYHPKHVEHFADINKLYIFASCWIIIDTYDAMHGPLNIKLGILCLWDRASSW